MAGAVLTERQKKWFATVQANLEASTGRPLADWVEIVRGCPETTRKGRAAWLKTEHGMGANHAAQILHAADPEDGGHGWDDPQALRAALWKEPAALAVLEAVEAVAAGVEGVISGQRKGYTSFSRAVQFAAIRPLKGGRALLGLKLEPEASPRLTAPTRKEGWSERLTAVLELADAASVDAEAAELFRRAAERG